MLNTFSFPCFCGAVLALAGCGSNGAAPASPPAGPSMSTPDAGLDADLPEPMPLHVEWRRSLSCTSGITSLSRGFTLDGDGNVVRVGFLDGTCRVFDGASMGTDGGASLFAVKLAASDGARTWGGFYGGGGHDGSLGWSAASGVGLTGTVLAGFFAGTLDLGKGPLTAVTADGTKTDLFVAKLEAAGNVAWSKSFATDGIFFGGHVAEDAAGAVLIAGSPMSPVDFGGGSIAANLSTLVVVKLKSDGAHDWSKALPGGFAATASITGIASDASGAAVLVGNFSQSFDFGGGIIPNAGATSLFLAKLDAAGNHVFSQGFRCSGAPGSTTCSARVTVDADGSIAVIGEFSGTLDLGGGGPFVAPDTGASFVARFDAGGHLAWRKLLSAERLNVAFAPSHDLVVAATFVGTLDLDGTSFVSKGRRDTAIFALSPAGDRTWVQRFGGEWDDTVDVLAVSPDGALLIEGGGDIGGLTPPGETEFVAKLRL
ncbi:MAG: hypothetical protein ABIP39_16445 [Polyangiaceae bacterium]